MRPGGDGSACGPLVNDSLGLRATTRGCELFIEKNLVRLRWLHERRLGIM